MAAYRCEDGWYEGHCEDDGDGRVDADNLTELVEQRQLRKRQHLMYRGSEQGVATKG